METYILTCRIRCAGCGFSEKMLVITRATSSEQAVKRLMDDPTYKTNEIEVKVYGIQNFTDAELENDARTMCMLL